jgi:LysM repeat protein
MALEHVAARYCSFRGRGRTGLLGGFSVATRRPPPGERSRAGHLSRATILRRRRILAGLSGLLVAAVLAGTSSGLAEGWWAAGSMGLLVTFYLGLLVRHRPHEPEPATGEWISPYLLDRWAITRFLWAGVAGCVFKLVVVLTERLARDGLPPSGLRRAMLERGVRLHCRLATRALWSLTASATAAATVTAGSSLVTSQAVSPSSRADEPTAAVSSTADAQALSVSSAATPGVVPAVASEDSITTYQVQPGDTLSGIAEQFGTTVAALAAANNIADPNLIYAGQVLTIVGPGNSAATSSTGGVLDASQIAQLVAGVGFQGASIWEFTAIALAESGGNPDAVSSATALGTQDYGLFQIDTSNLGFVPDGDWANPVDNAEAAFAISDGGSNPSLWCTWPGGCGGAGSGTAAQFFSVAQAAAAPFDGDQ